jgi:hypothetical protein
MKKGDKVPQQMQVTGRETKGNGGAWAQMDAASKVGKDLAVILICLSDPRPRM